MSPTDKVLGSIAAIQTLIENFPMSILEFGRGKQYTSVYEFILDVLYTCGVDTNKIIDFCLENIYGLENTVKGGIEGLYDRISDINVGIGEQSIFIQGLEYSIKVILMGLFTSLMTCSAQPILPDNIFDYDSLHNFMPSTYSYREFIIPVKLMDFINLLSIPPTTNRGRLYYLTEGRDKFYRKTDEIITTKEPRITTVSAGETITAQVNKYSQQIKVIFNYDDDETMYFTLSSALPKKIKISVGFIEGGRNYHKIHNFNINQGSLSSEHYKLVGRKNEKKSDILNIIIENKPMGGSVRNGDELYWVYLSKPESMTGINNFASKGGSTAKLLGSVQYGESKENEKVYKTITASADTTTTSFVDVETHVVHYVEVPRNDYVAEKAVQMYSIPTEITDNSPEYIKCFDSDGANPNMLYRTYDMNAFIWYVLNRGSKTPQIEYNHMMWDSRVSAFKDGIARSSSSDWNNWYESKATVGGEFAYNGDVSSKVLYPLIQLEKYSDYGLMVKIPAQKYYKPRKRKAILENKPYNNDIVMFNSTLYKFDWDYLQNIQILNPKMLLARLCESLMGFAINEINAVNFNLVDKSIKAKLSSAIRNIIENDDMEVEDCYKTFSNDEFNELLEELNAARYKASQYNGEKTKANVHDINSYIGNLDAVNDNTTTEGTTTKIKRLVNNVMADPGTEAVLEYEPGFTYDKNILNKFIWALVLPIIESLFTPQVMLLIIMNLNLVGIVKVEDVFGNDMGFILNVILNKILGLTKSLVLFIKDKILSLLLKLLYDYIIPLSVRWVLMTYLERLNGWLATLNAAIYCLPTFRFKLPKLLTSIEDVDYADIVNNQNLPEVSDGCN